MEVNIKSEVMKKIAQNVEKRKPLIVGFEGIDGSSKGTQSELMATALENMGYKVLVADFPSYSEFFGKEIGRLLSGKDIVDANSTEPKSMALWYALDRFEFFKTHNINEYDVVIMNRSTYSNVGFQTTRVHVDKQKEFIDWLFELEFEKLHIPKPDLVYYLSIDAETSSKNVAKKGHRDYVGDSADVYESSDSMMNDVINVYDYIASIEDSFVKVNCLNEDGNMYSIMEINQKLIMPVGKLVEVRYHQHD